MSVVRDYSLLECGFAAAFRLSDCYYSSSSTGLAPLCKVLSWRVPVCRSYVCTAQCVPMMDSLQRSSDAKRLRYKPKELSVQ